MARGLAEFLIVVFGVAVALAAENWREGQADRVLERQYLERLLTELQEGQPTVALWTDRLDAARNSIDSLLSWSGRSHLRDSSEVARAVVVSTAARFNPAGVVLDLTYRELIGTGSLNLIQDPAVRDRITQYYRLAYRVEDALEASQFGAYRDWPEAVMGAVGRNPDPAMSLAPTDIARTVGLLAAPDWPRQIRAFRARSEIVEMWLDRLLVGTDELILLLEDDAA